MEQVLAPARSRMRSATPRQTPPSAQENLEAEAADLEPSLDSILREGVRCLKEDYDDTACDFLAKLAAHVRDVAKYSTAKMEALGSECPIKLKLRT